MMLWEREIESPFLSPFRTLQAMRAELERAWAGSALPQTALPPFALFKKGDSLLLRALLPGISAEHLAIEVDGNELSIAAEWPADPALENARATHAERPRGRFSRSLRLPFEVDATKVRARLQHGLLEIELSPSPAAAPVRIPVTSSATPDTERKS